MFERGSTERTSSDYSPADRFDFCKRGFFVDQFVDLCTEREFVSHFELKKIAKIREFVNVFTQFIKIRSPHSTGPIVCSVGL